MAERYGQHLVRMVQDCGWFGFRSVNAFVKTQRNQFLAWETARKYRDLATGFGFRITDARPRSLNWLVPATLASRWQPGAGCKNRGYPYCAVRSVSRVKSDAGTGEGSNLLNFFTAYSGPSRSARFPRGPVPLRRYLRIAVFDSNDLGGLSEKILDWMDDAFG